MASLHLHWPNAPCGFSFGNPKGRLRCDQEVAAADCTTPSRLDLPGWIEVGLRDPPFSSGLPSPQASFRIPPVPTESNLRFPIWDVRSSSSQLHLLRPFTFTLTKCPFPFSIRYCRQKNAQDTCPGHFSFSSHSRGRDELSGGEGNRHLWASSISSLVSFAKTTSWPRATQVS